MHTGGAPKHMTLPEVQKHSSVGRPRSAEAHQAILAATVELLAEEGFEGMSIEAVANRARVGKTTIYRRWSTKEALVLDALSELRVKAPIVDTGNFRADMVALLREAVRSHSQITNPLQLKLLSRIVGEIYAHPELFSVFYGQLHAPRLQQIELLIERAQARGELSQEVDPIFVMSLVAGPLLFHALVSTVVPTKHTLDDLVELTVDAVLYGIEDRYKESEP
jgi:AcrR family transcriptional regulator